MNCLEFRREKLADPRRLSASAQHHLSRCAACQAFARRIDESEARLGKALQVAAPDGLADRVLLAVLGGRRLRMRLLALAATVVLTVGIGFAWWHESQPADEYAKMAIEHVMHEPESFTTVKNADPDFFRQVMHEFGGEIQVPLGKVRYIRLCPVPGGTGWHIVFETEHGLATLLLIPEQHPKRKMEQATIGGWNAMAMPGGRGFYAIVTSSPQDTLTMSKMIKQRVRWIT